MTRGDGILYSAAILLLAAPVPLIVWAWYKWVSIGQAEEGGLTTIVLSLLSVSYLLCLLTAWLVPHYSPLRTGIIGLNLMLTVGALGWSLAKAHSLRRTLIGLACLMVLVWFYLLTVSSVV